MKLFAAAWTLWLGLVLIASVALAQEATPKAADIGAQRVFVCGHSFHIFTAKILPDLEKGAGLKSSLAGSQMLGGSRTLAHWNLPDEKNKAKAALRAGEVDVLTVSPHALLPDEGIDNFTKLGLEKNQNLRVLVQSSWPTNDGSLNPKFKNDDRNKTTTAQLRAMRTMHAELWLKNLEAQVNTLNKDVGRKCVFIVPASDAVFTLREKVADGKVPGITGQAQLFSDPLGHAKSPLMALVAYCQYAAIYRKTPVGLPVPVVLKDAAQATELNKLLQEIAWEAVTSYPMSGVEK